jgi:ubiquinone/menaquinone biosynthesis C-methylase UbiE
MLDGVKFRDGRHSDKILDVGCGTGFISQLYPNFDITGIDISDGMLEKNPFIWKKAPVEEIPFPDETFDVVVCRSLLHHLDNPDIGLKEMVRVLKHGGKWVCWDPNAGTLATWFRKLFQKTDRFSHVHHSFNDKQLFGMIEDAGLKITEKRYIGFLAYPLLGFPDIFNFKIPINLGRWIINIDDWISKTPLKSMAWSLMVKGMKL